MQKTLSDMLFPLDLQAFCEDVQGSVITKTLLNGQDFLTLLQKFTSTLPTPIWSSKYKGDSLTALISVMSVLSGLVHLSTLHERRVGELRTAKVMHDCSGTCSFIFLAMLSNLERMRVPEYEIKAWEKLHPRLTALMGCIITGKGLTPYWVALQGDPHEALLRHLAIDLQQVLHGELNFELQFPLQLDLMFGADHVQLRPYNGLELSTCLYLLAETEEELELVDSKLKGDTPKDVQDSLKAYFLERAQAKPAEFVEILREAKMVKLDLSLPLQFLSSLQDQAYLNGVLIEVTPESI